VQQRIDQDVGHVPGGKKALNTLLDADKQKKRLLRDAESTARGTFKIGNLSAVGKILNFGRQTAARSAPGVSKAVGGVAEGLFKLSAAEKLGFVDSLPGPLPHWADRFAALISPEKRRALKRVDSLHDREDKGKWDDFLQHAERKSYAKSLGRDPRSDDKLARHADQMNRLLTGKPKGTVPSSDGKGTYNIIRLRGGGLGCTCNDWRYKKSVAPDGSQDCKHIRRWKGNRG